MTAIAVGAETPAAHCRAGTGDERAASAAGAHDRVVTLVTSSYSRPDGPSSYVITVMHGTVAGTYDSPLGMLGSLTVT